MVQCTPTLCCRWLHLAFLVTNVLSCIVARTLLRVRPFILRCLISSLKKITIYFFLSKVVPWLSGFVIRNFELVLTSSSWSFTGPICILEHFSAWTLWSNLRALNCFCVPTCLVCKKHYCDLNSKVLTLLSNKLLMSLIKVKFFACMEVPCLCCSILHTKTSPMPHAVPFLRTCLSETWDILTSSYMTGGVKSDWEPNHLHMHWKHCRQHIFFEKAWSFGTAHPKVTEISSRRCILALIFETFYLEIGILS